MRWRFELFSLDFALGAVLFSVIAAYTFGTFGPEISFSDRILVAGRSSQAYLAGAGMIFALGNLLLLASIRLVGMALAYLLTATVAAFVFCLLNIRSAEPLPLSLALLLLLLGGLSAGVAALRSFPPDQRSRAFKGILLATLAAISFAVFQPVVRNAADQEFGSGPYATVLMASVGMLLGTPLFNFFFMNIKIVGGQIAFPHYVAGSWRVHVNGIAAGAVFAAGLLALLLPLAAPAAERPGLPLLLGTLGGSVLILIFLGIVWWREPVVAGRPARWFFLSLAMLTCGLVAIACDNVTVSQLS